jgi:hypothetical protein
MCEEMAFAILAGRLGEVANKSQWAAKRIRTTSTSATVHDSAVIVMQADGDQIRA